ncbi:PEP-CTERM sorting domain-containing protein [Roseimaritima ulvae]|nr:PEP-CTERM sorting domain-containing protein [Roseimaritima ulvae]
MALLFSPAVANAGVFVDFTNFDSRMTELAVSAGVTGFNAGELSTLETGIVSVLENAYQDFIGLSFSTVDPGGTRPVVTFGTAASPGSLGVANHIDFLNRVSGDTARVFSANFDFVVDEFSGNNNRAEQISQLTAALGGTAVHELGHNLGLRHHDAYGDLTYTGSPINTGGVQNGNWMATGSTGLGEQGRQVPRTFSTNSLVKLAYAEGTLDNNPVAVQEAGDAGDSIGSAMAVSFETIPVANRFGEVVIGEISTSSDIDFYAVQLAANSLFTADINVDYAAGFPFDNVNTTLSLFDMAGNQLATDDVSVYSGNTFGSGGFGDGFDPALFNVNIATAGTYYVQVASEGSDIGDYQLLMHTNSSTHMVPEPSSIVLFGMFAGTVCCSVRRRRSASKELRI